MTSRVAGVCVAVWLRALRALLWCSIKYNNVGASGAAAVAAALVHVAQLHVLKYAGAAEEDRAACVLVAARIGLEHNSCCFQLLLSRRVLRVWCSSLGSNSVEDVGASTVAAALIHVPQLQKLM